MKKGIGGIIAEDEERKNDPELTSAGHEFLDSLIIAYRGMSRLIERYRDYADELARRAEGSERERLISIARVCDHIRIEPPASFREAVQLLWFGHLGTIIESFYFICYGRLDVILGEFIGDTPDGEALELLECLLLKMYDQADVNDKTYLNKHEGQLVVTLGGRLADGRCAVNRVTLLILRAASGVRLPEPEINLRVTEDDPEELMKIASEMTVSGCNFLSYYNDERIVEALSLAGLPPEDARDYGFDLCQDINIPGRCDTWCAVDLPMLRELLGLLDTRTDFPDFKSLLTAYKECLSRSVDERIEYYNSRGRVMMLYRNGKYEEYFTAIRELPNADRWDGRSPMCPLPYLSGLYHGTVESATDMIYESYPYKHRGAMCGTAVETVNSLAAIKKVVYEDKRYSLAEVVAACKENFSGMPSEVMRGHLLRAPKWGNDDPYVDLIAKEILEFCLLKFTKCRTFSGGILLSGIHQPHPVSTGWRLPASPDGRRAGAPVAVTLTPESGTARGGPTAALASATVFDSRLIQWNFCVMVNYYASVFRGNGGSEVFRELLRGYFKRGGIQHQPNVMDAAELRAAQREPEKYKDLIVRLWGVSAHFVDLSSELQDELIARLG